PQVGHARGGGVGPRGSTGEAAEQRGFCLSGGCGGKPADQGEPGPISHQPDTERGRGVPRVGSGAPGGAGKETGAVHQSAPPCERRSTTAELLRLEAKSRAGSGRGEV